MRDTHGQELSLGTRVMERAGALGKIDALIGEDRVRVCWETGAAAIIGTSTIVPVESVFKTDQLPPNVARQAIFYMVYGRHQGAPKTEHYDQSRAWNEAQRLARENPGIEFFVLKMERGAKVHKPEPPPIIMIEGDPDEIPF